MLSKAAWGKGYASEAADLVIKFGFEELGLHKISATCEPLNFASAKVLQKAGLRIEGYLHKHFFIKGQWRDSLLFGCVREERSTNMQERRLKPRVLGIGEITAVPLREFPRVSLAPLTPAFGGGSVHNLFMRAGAQLGPLTNVMDEYLVVLNGSLSSGGATLERGAVLHCPGGVRRRFYRMRQSLTPKYCVSDLVLQGKRVKQTPSLIRPLIEVWFASGEFDLPRGDSTDLGALWRALVNGAR